MIRVKQFTINVILILLLMSLTIAIVLPLIADKQFKAARRMEIGYRWKIAEQKYQTAIKLAPFNTEYISEYGRFLFRQSAYRKDNTLSLLKQAEQLYKKVLRLNPGYAEYALGLGRIQIKIYKNDTEINKGNINNAFKNFQTALNNSPNVFNTSYSIGLAGIASWPFLDESDKGLVLDSLGYALELRPWYLDRAYNHVWRYTKDPDLLKRITPYRALHLYEEEEEKKERLRKIEEMKSAVGGDYPAGNSIAPSDWHGRAYHSNNVYINGNMYWTGTIDSLINTFEGEAMIKIQAKGSQAYGIWPYMSVELDGEKIGEMFVESSDWKEYSFKINTDAGIKVLSITFPNDGSNKKTEEDRNLYIGEARISNAAE